MVRSERLMKISPVLLALAAITMGAYLPWVRPNPGLDQIPSIGFPGQNAGIGIFSLLLLLGVVLVLLVLFRGDDSRFQSLTEIVVGIGAIALLLYYLYSNSFVGFDAEFVPTYGWYVMLIGAIVLICVGSVQLAYPKFRARLSPLRTVWP